LWFCYMQLLRHVLKTVATSDPLLVVLLFCIEPLGTYCYICFKWRPTCFYVIGLSGDDLKFYPFRRVECKIGYCAVYIMNTWNVIYSPLWDNHEKQGRIRACMTCRNSNSEHARPFTPCRQFLTCLCIRKIFV
jgi:hypothetical protein